MGSPGTYPHQKPARPLRTALVRTAWVLAAAGLLWALYSVPYDILRTERLRAYGEVETRGVVQGKSESRDANGRTLLLVEYVYEDGSGLLRKAEAPFDPDRYAVFQPGDPLTVFYARADPTIVRAEGQIEPWLQERLRTFLGQ